MNAGLRRGIAHHADGFAGAFAGAGVGLRTLSADRQTAQVADAPVAFDGLEALEVQTEFTAEVALDDIFAFLDGVDDLGQLLFVQILGPDAG